MYEMGKPELDAVAKVVRSGQTSRCRGGEGGETRERNNLPVTLDLDR